MQSSIPGQRTGRTHTNRTALFSSVGLRYGQGAMVVDATYAKDGGNTGYTQELRAGTIMAQITTSGLWVPCKRTAISAAGVSLSQSAPSALIAVDDARAFLAGDEITVNATSGKIISSVNYETNVITLTVAMDTDLADGDPVFASGSALAGAEIARGILDEHINLVDEDGTARDKSFAKLIVAGMCRKDMILGDIAAVLAATDQLGFIQWAEDQGLV